MNMDTNVALSTLLLILHHVCCEGFDFTLELPVPEPSQVDTGRRVCGVLHCTETLPTGPSNQVNRSRSLTSFTVSRLRPGPGGSASEPLRWQQLASVTPQQPGLDRVSDGIKASGQLSDQQASLSLELTKIDDCHYNQFACVAISVDDQGRTSVKKSLVGKAVDSQVFGPRIHSAKASMPEVPASSDVASLAGTLVQLTSSVQNKLDWVESRLEDSLQALESRLGDRVGEMGGRFVALDSKMDTLENRLEDKMTQMQDRLVQTLGQTKTASSGDTSMCSQLATKLDGLDRKVESNTGKLEECVTKVTKQTKSTNGVKESLSGHLATVTTSVQAIERNLTVLGKLEASLDQCVDTRDDSGLAGLVSEMSSLSGLTQDLVSEMELFRHAYRHGALEPVDEFFDLLGDGKKEWRLVFRGTPYNNVRVYPAYLHGTGIPLEVEAGCKQFNRSLPCVNHYRNRDAFDNWAGIDEILFAVFKDDQMVKSVVFNGKGSTPTDWFAINHVIQSNWSDLTKQPHNFFSMAGDTAVRRFFINLDYDKGCSGYRGWFRASDTIEACDDEKSKVAIPMFQYAPGNTFAVWPTTAAVADAFGIFLKYE